VKLKINDQLYGTALFLVACLCNLTVFVCYTDTSSAIAGRPRALRVIEYFAKSLKITQRHSK